MAQVLDLSIPQIYGLARETAASTTFDDLVEPNVLNNLLDVDLPQSFQWTSYHTSTPTPPTQSPHHSLPTENGNQNH